MGEAACLPDSKTGSTLMNALHFVEVGKLEWHEARDLRVQGSLEAVVRPIASTTCDLDRRIIRGLVSFGENFPIGHECVAEVLETGDKVRTVRPGDVVVVPWHISCGVCAECRRGLPAACSSAPGIAGYGVPIGGQWGGLFSEEVRVPFADGMLVPLPDGVDPVSAASASDNLTEAYIAVSRGMAKHPRAPVLVVSSLPAWVSSPSIMPWRPARPGSISWTRTRSGARRRECSAPTCIPASFPSSTCASPS